MLFIIIAIVLVLLGFIVLKKKGFGVLSIVAGLLCIPINIFFAIILVLFGIILLGVC